MDKSEEHTKGSVMTKTHSNKQTNYARKCLDDLWCTCIWFECLENEFSIKYLSKISQMSLGFFRSQELGQRNEKVWYL